MLRHYVTSSIRQFHRTRGDSVVAVIALSIGIGASALLLALTSATLVHPLPFRRASRLYLVKLADPAYPRLRLGVSEIQAERIGALPSVRAALLVDAGPAVWTIGGRSNQLVTAAVSPDFLRTLGVQPVRGRLFGLAAHVAVISEVLSRARFGSNAKAIGQSIVLHDVPYRVIGIVPQLRLPTIVRDPDVWIPAGRSAALADSGGFTVVALLTRGARKAQFTARLRALSAMLARRDPTLAGWALTPVSWRQAAVRGSRPVLLLLLMATLLVLGIAVLNVLGLLLARTWRRGSEIAVRRILGAGRGALAQQFFTEGFLLAIGGGITGSLLAGWAAVPLRQWLLAALPDVAPPDPLPIVLWALVASLLVGLLIGSATGVAAAGIGSSALGARESSQRWSTKRRHATTVFVVAEVVVTASLLLCSGLMARSLAALSEVHTGLDTKQVVTMSVQLPQVRYARPAEKIAFLRHTIATLKARLGAGEIAATDVPLFRDVTFVGRAHVGEANIGHLEFRTVTPGYFHLLGIPILRGRRLITRDAVGRAAATQDALVSRRLANEAWPGLDPVGRHIRLPGLTLVVTGVAGNTRDNRLSSPPCRSFMRRSRSIRRPR